MIALVIAWAGPCFRLIGVMKSTHHSRESPSESAPAASRELVGVPSQVIGATCQVSTASSLENT